MSPLPWWLVDALPRGMHGAVALWTTLWRHADWKPSGNGAGPDHATIEIGHTRITELLGCSSNSVKRWLQALEDAGGLKTDSSRKRHRYTLYRQHAGAADHSDIATDQILNYPVGGPDHSDIATDGGPDHSDIATDGGPDHSDMTTDQHGDHSDIATDEPPITAIQRPISVKSVAISLQVPDLREEQTGGGKRAGARKDPPPSFEGIERNGDRNGGGGLAERLLHELRERAHREGWILPAVSGRHAARLEDLLRSREVLPREITGLAGELTRWAAERPDALLNDDGALLDEKLPRVRAPRSGGLAAALLAEKWEDVRRRLIDALERGKTRGAAIAGAIKMTAWTAEALADRIDREPVLRAAVETAERYAESSRAFASSNEPRPRPEFLEPIADHSDIATDEAPERPSSPPEKPKAQKSKTETNPDHSDLTTDGADLPESRTDSTSDHSDIATDGDALDMLIADVAADQSVSVAAIVGDSRTAGACSARNEVLRRAADVGVTMPRLVEELGRTETSIKRLTRRAQRQAQPTATGERSR